MAYRKNRTAIKGFLKGKFTVTEVNKVSKQLAKLRAGDYPHGLGKPTNWLVVTRFGKLAHRWILSAIAKLRNADDIVVSRDYSSSDHGKFEVLFRGNEFVIWDIPTDAVRLPK